jgi:hypothetical protein
MRLFGLLTALMVLAGCGSSAGSGDGATLGFAVATTSEDFAQQMADGGTYAASKSRRRSSTGWSCGSAGRPGSTGPPR